MPKIEEEQFRKMVENRLGECFTRALTVFNNYGPRLSFDVTNVLMHAGDQGKADEVLVVLEQHWNEHLQYQHPEIRGTVHGEFGINKTKAMFVELCTKTLNLQPTS